MMRRSPDFADVWTPDGGDLEMALERVTHLAIGAHSDDLEIMAFHGILECYGREDRRFAGVVCSDGAGSPRSPVDTAVSTEEWVRRRIREQREAARIGDYAALVQMGFSSASVRSPSLEFVEALGSVFGYVRPRVVYTHNLADRHPTHVGTVLAVIRSLRERPAESRPERLLGCEVWRDLDWLSASDRVELDVSARPDLAQRLIEAFRSQVSGDKAYGAAVRGRRQAHATFSRFDAPDHAEGLTLAMDLTPLMTESAPSPEDFVARLIARFQADVRRLLTDSGKGFPRP